MKNTLTVTSLMLLSLILGVLAGRYLSREPPSEPPERMTREVLLGLNRGEDGWAIDREYHPRVDVYAGEKVLWGCRCLDEERRCDCPEDVQFKVEDLHVFDGNGAVEVFLDMLDPATQALPRICDGEAAVLEDLRGGATPLSFGGWKPPTEWGVEVVSDPVSPTGHEVVKFTWRVRFGDQEEIWDPHIYTHEDPYG